MFFRAAPLGHLPQRALLRILYISDLTNLTNSSDLKENATHSLNYDKLLTAHTHTTHTNIYICVCVYACVLQY